METTLDQDRVIAKWLINRMYNTIIILDYTSLIEDVITTAFEPSQVFNTSVLEKWAKENGWTQNNTELAELEQLRQWLNDLMQAQNQITRLYKEELMCTDTMSTAMEKRNVFMDRVVYFVEKLIRKQQS